MASTLNTVKFHQPYLLLPPYSSFYHSGGGVLLTLEAQARATSKESPVEPVVEQPDLPQIRRLALLARVREPAAEQVVLEFHLCKVGGRANRPSGMDPFR